MFGQVDVRELMLKNKDSTKGVGIDGNYSSLLDMESDDMYVYVTQKEERRMIRFVRMRKIMIMI